MAGERGIGNFWREIQISNIFSFLCPIQLPVIDASNKTGSMEFACGGNADDFFPVRVSFYSKKSYSEIQVRLCSVMSRQL